MSFFPKQSGWNIPVLDSGLPTQEPKGREHEPKMAATRSLEHRV